MKTVDKDELFQNLSGFLKAKGIELKDGSYTHRVQQGCNLLADVVNTTQKTVRRAKAKADETLDHLRQSIHKATAPKPPGDPRAGGKRPRANPSKKANASAKSKPRTKSSRRK